MPYPCPVGRGDAFPRFGRPEVVQRLKCCILSDNSARLYGLELTDVLVDEGYHRG